jgi:putative NADH-flavin reductase
MALRGQRAQQVDRLKECIALYQPDNLKLAYFCACKINLITIKLMKIVIFGASGKTGLLVVNEALALGYEVIAYVRNKESIKLDNPNLKVVEGHLNEKDKLKLAITGSDACISTLGGKSLTKHSLEILEGIDNIVTIMEEVNVKRFIYMSSHGVGNSRTSIPQPFRFLIVDLMLRVPMADHNTNESRIAESRLEWTFVRPGGLTDGAKTGNMKHGHIETKLKGSVSISRSNVAVFLLNQVTNKDYVNKSVWLHE